MTVRVNKDSGEIFLYGIVGDSWGEDSFTAGDVIDALGKLGGKRCTVRVNSPGGIADEGIAIYNALKRYAGGCDTVVDAIAASAASVIALAGDTRTTSAGGRWMIHRALNIAIGNANDMRKNADVLETYDKSLVEIYGKYIQKPADEIMQLLDAETWYTSEDSVTAGLSTHLGDTVAAEPMVAAWFKNAPANLLQKPTPWIKAQTAQLAGIKAKAMQCRS